MLSGVVIWEAVARLTSGAATRRGYILGFAVIVVSIVVDFRSLARALHRVAAETGSEALEADALHFSSDLWSSVAVLPAASQRLKLLG